MKNSAIYQLTIKGLNRTAEMTWHETSTIQLNRGWRCCVANAAKGFAKVEIGLSLFLEMAQERRMETDL
jgi:hypothetical protein